MYHEHLPPSHGYGTEHLMTIIYPNRLKCWLMVLLKVITYVWRTSEPGEKHTRWGDLYHIYKWGHTMLLTDVSGVSCVYYPTVQTFMACTTFITGRQYFLNLNYSFWNKTKPNSSIQIKYIARNQGVTIRLMNFYLKSVFILVDNLNPSYPI